MLSNRIFDVSLGGDVTEVNGSERDTDAEMRGNNVKDGGNEILSLLEADREFVTV